MNYSKLVPYILLISLIWISCGKDDINPEITILSPEANTSFSIDDILTLEFTVTDNEALERGFISLLYADGSGNVINFQLEGDNQTITENITLDGTQSGPLSINIEVFDEAGNSATANRQFDYNFFLKGSLDINIKLEYNGDPLVIFEDYAYPDGRKIDFTRVSFYTSEFDLDNTQINEVEFHNLTNSHASPSSAANGYFWKVENVPAGSYSELSFNIGVPAELNSKDPGEFPSGHPLAKPAENWFSWKSFIFFKLEGNIDLDGDELNETGIALHTGADEALRRITIDYPIEVLENQSTSVELIFDIYELLEGKDRIFPIEENPQIHSLSQLDAVLELSDNIEIAIQK